MSPLTARRLAATFGLIAVALGAFGAHGLKALLAQTGGVELWEKAAHYHLVHAVVLLWLSGRAVVPRCAFLCFTAGILLFSGSLYLYAATKTLWLVHLTPVGGGLLLAGWICVALRED